MPGDRDWKTAFSDSSWRHSTKERTRGSARWHRERLHRAAGALSAGKCTGGLQEENAAEFPLLGRAFSQLMLHLNHSDIVFSAAFEKCY